MVYVLLGAGFEEIEAVAPIDVMRRAGIQVKTLGIGGDVITGVGGIPMKSDEALGANDYIDLEMLVLPGGGGGVKTIRSSGTAMALIKKAVSDRKLVGAICAAPVILAELGFLKGKRAVCYPDHEPEMEKYGAKPQRDECVVQDDNIITAQAAGSAIDFGLKLVTVLRGWEAAERVRRAIYYEGNIRPLT